MWHSWTWSMHMTRWCTSMGIEIDAFRVFWIAHTHQLRTKSRCKTWQSLTKTFRLNLSKESQSRMLLDSLKNLSASSILVTRVMRVVYFKFITVWPHLQSRFLVISQPLLKLYLARKVQKLSRVRKLWSRSKNYLVESHLENRTMLIQAQFWLP